MSMSVKYDGNELNTLFDVIEGFTPFDGNDIEVQIDDIITGGSRVTSTRRTRRIMDMPFYIRGGKLTEKFDKLNSILCLDENNPAPKPLILGVHPNRTYYAVASASFDVDEKDMTAFGTIHWIIPDGIAHSNVRKENTFKKSADGILEVEVVNEGSDWATVDYSMTMNHENGFVGFVSQYGAIQLGNPQEADMVPAKKSVVVVPRRSKLDWTGWVNGTNFGENSQKKHVVALTGSSSGLGVGPSNIADTGGGLYYGGIKEYTFSEPMTDWYAWGRFGFETGLMGQSGILTLVFVDASNKMIAGYDLYKNDTIGNTATQVFMTRNGYKKVLNWTPSYWVPPNPYGSQSRSQNRDMFDIKKEGNKVTFFWFGGYFSFTDDSIKSVPATKVQLFVGQYKGRNFNNQRVTRMYLDDITVIGNNVPYMKDVPNRYQPNTIVTIDGMNKIPYFNNLPRYSDEVLGSTYFKVPPGKTIIRALYSDFSIPEPDAKCWVNEVYR